MQLANSLKVMTKDARHWQIAALGTLILYSFLYLDFGATPIATAVALSTTLAAQLICARLWRQPFEWRSAMITGLSLSLLLRTGDLWVLAVAALAAILSKFLIRLDGKHVFNPAAFGIAVALFGTGHAWVSPGQWGASAWMVALIFLLGGAVLTRAPRLDTAIAFLAAHLALLLARAAWLGDPLAIPLHQIMTGSLLIFAFFMITDPRTTPDSRFGRLFFAVTVATLAHWFAFYAQFRPALYVSLLLISPLVPLIDRMLPRQRFNWIIGLPAVGKS